MSMNKKKTDHSNPRRDLGLEMSTRVLVIEPIKERWEDLVQDPRNPPWAVYDNIANENGDSGLDLYLPRDITVPGNTRGMKIPLGIRVSMQQQKNICCSGCGKTEQRVLPCALYPRSSTGARTPLRLSNSVGIIDAGYWGEVIALVDNLADEPFTLKEGERYFQICRGDLKPFTTKVGSVDTDTARGANGLGSTGH